ncbi:hypothetical protein EV356DRAFT_504376 [Viridothelium virens]|uniref:Uncharacterized protein n=1 Tax=Viridothelium virens TaxID=1048519 RepID=A0A6A6HLW3_VIRVR|nr:hypothetical protein EV356DRAFT_504376 [Viridothelium virens]
MSRTYKEPDRLQIVLSIGLIVEKRPTNGRAIFLIITTHLCGAFGFGAFPAQ